MEPSVCLHWAPMIYWFITNHLWVSFLRWHMVNNYVYGVHLQWRHLEQLHKTQFFSTIYWYSNNDTTWFKLLKVSLEHIYTTWVSCVLLNWHIRLANSTSMASNWWSKSLWHGYWLGVYCLGSSFLLCWEVEPVRNMQSLSHLFMVCHWIVT